MEKFIDRKAEMETLQSEYERKGSSLVILYGRRRVGKTTLISEFIKDKNALFFLASEESEAQNRAAFKDRAADFIDSDLLRVADVKTWDAVFKAIMDSIHESKPVIVIDEFQYIGKSNPAFPSVFQRIWEELLEGSFGYGDSLWFADFHDDVSDAGVYQSVVWETDRTNPDDTDSFSIL